jgi:hypothetical protein
MDKETIWREIATLAKYYDADDRMTPEVMNLYVEHLRDMEHQTFKLAVNRHMETSKWMPKISEIREAAMQNLMKRAGVPQPAQAWKEVSDNLKDDKQVQCGTLQKVNRLNDHNWSHPLVKQAAENIGWQDLCYAYQAGNAGAMVSNRARYMDAYRDLVKDLKEHYSLSSDLREAIEPPEQPQLPDPEPEQVKRDRPTLTDVLDSDEYGPHTMPEHVREKWQAMKKKMEVSK